MTLEEVLPTGQLPTRNIFYWHGKKIAYLDIGEGETFLCLPGWLSPSIFFLPLHQAFKGQIRLISIDLPGWAGLSDNILDPHPDFFLELINDFIEYLHLKDFILVGYSYGGMLSQFIATKHASHLKKLILISPPADLSWVRTEISWILWLYGWLTSLQVPFAVLRQVIRLSMLYDFFKRTPYFLLITHDYFHACVNESTTFSVRAAFNCLLKSCQVIPAYKKLRKIPTLLIKADNEPTFVEKGVAHLSRELKIDPIIVPNTDHGHVLFDLLTHKKLAYQLMS
ncbi:MAG TPA: alpha/beta hydrolase [Patescibacteria group bacterium]